MDVLPEPLRHDAAESIGGTYAVLAQAGPAAARLQQAASDAFVHAMHVTALGAAAAALLGSVVVWAWLPGRRKSGDQAEVGQRAPADAGAR